MTKNQRDFFIGFIAYSIYMWVTDSTIRHKRLQVYSAAVGGHVKHARNWTLSTYAEMKLTNIWGSNDNAILQGSAVTLWTWDKSCIRDAYRVSLGICQWKNYENTSTVHFKFYPTHTHPFNGPFSGTTQVSRTQVSRFQVLSKWAVFNTV